MQNFSWEKVITLFASKGDASMSIERRRNKRFQGKEGAYAALLRPDHSFDLGKIVDISNGGVCISYLATGKPRKGQTEVKIFGMNGKFLHLDRMRCSIIYDVDIDATTWNVIVTRRCGIQFSNLNHRHLAMLDSFIEGFTTGDAP
jgi:hypothetical protein